MLRKFDIVFVDPVKLLSFVISLASSQLMLLVHAPSALPSSSLCYRKACLCFFKVVTIDLDSAVDL